MGVFVAFFGFLSELFAASDASYQRKAPDIHKYCVSIKNVPGTTRTTGDISGLYDTCYIENGTAYCNPGCIVYNKTFNGYNDGYTYTVPAGTFFINGYGDKDSSGSGIGLSTGITGMSGNLPFWFPYYYDGGAVSDSYWDQFCHHAFDATNAIETSNMPVYMCGRGSYGNTVQGTGDYEYCSCDVSGGQICFYDTRFMVFLMGMQQEAASGYEAASVGLTQNQINNMPHRPIVYENLGCERTADYQKNSLSSTICNKSKFTNLCEPCPSAPEGGLNEIIEDTAVVVGDVGLSSCAIKGTFHDDSGDYVYPSGCKYAQ